MPILRQVQFLNTIKTVGNGPSNQRCEKTDTAAEKKAGQSHEAHREAAVGLRNIPAVEILLNDTPHRVFEVTKVDSGGSIQHHQVVLRVYAQKVEITLRNPPPLSSLQA
jgi:hypothetical protein